MLTGRPIPFGQESTGTRVLLVEDDPAVARVLLMALLRLPADVCLATTGAHAMALLKSNRFDLVVTDYLLPGADGMEVARAASDHGAPSLLLSGLLRDNMMRRMPGMRHVSAFLAKPVSPRLLTETAREVLRAAA